jgi:hypothetical protein
MGAGWEFNAAIREGSGGDLETPGTRVRAAWFFSLCTVPLHSISYFSSSFTFSFSIPVLLVL